MIPVSQPYISERMKNYAFDAINSGWISSLGDYQLRFASSLSDFYCPYNAVTCSSGTTALHLALEALGIGEGDSVIVPDVSFVATVNAVLYASAIPILAPVNPIDGNLDLSSLPSLITPNVKAVLVTHLYGLCCDMEHLARITNKYNILLIEDCAESFGSFSDSSCARLLGTFGDASCFSFYGNKTITTGEGGAVLFRDQFAYEKAIMLRDHGMSSTQRYFHFLKGYNYRMTNVQAAFGLAQLEEYSFIHDTRKNILLEYQKHLDGSNISIQPNTSFTLPWLINISIANQPKSFYDGLAIYLRENNIDSRPLFRPFHTFPYLNNFQSIPLITSFLFCDSGISLPTFIALGESEIAYICKTILSFQYLIS